MRLQHAEHETELTSRAGFYREDLQKIMALAARLQEERKEQLSPQEVEAIGQELGIAPEFMRAAMEQLRTPQVETRTVPVQRSQAPVRRRNFALGVVVAMLSLWLMMVGIYVSRAQQSASAVPATAVVSEVPVVLPPPYVAVDLDAAANQSIFDPIHGSGTELSTLPQGMTKLGGTYFRLSGRLVHLQGAHARQWPAEAVLPVAQKVRKLHFLHSTGYGAGLKLPAGTEIGEYVVHYADGTTAQVPIVYGEDVLDWWEHEGDPPLSRGRVAWIGSIEGTREHRVRLFKSEWRNPHPGKTVTIVRYRSHGTECDPFLAGLTAEP